MVQMKFGDEEVLFKLECEWRAHLMQNKDGKYGFNFSEISNLHDHALSCFDGCGHAQKNHRTCFRARQIPRLPVAE